MNSFWDVLWLVVIAFLLLCYLVVLFQIVTDLFHDGELSGWSKALWVLALVLVPLLSSLVYLIARGQSMARRSVASSAALQQDAEDYVRQVTAVALSPSEEIARAVALHEAGRITDAEFESLKAYALARSA